MTAQTITVVGARGGSGTSTIAAAAALFAARIVATELVARDVDSAAALLGLGASGTTDAPMDVAERLTLASVRYRRRVGCRGRRGASRPTRSPADRPAARRPTRPLLPRLAQHREQRAAPGRDRGAERDGPQPHPARRAGRVRRARRRPGPRQRARRPNDRRRPPRHPLARAARARRPSPVRRHARLRDQSCRRVPQPTSLSPTAAALSRAFPESVNRLATP